MEKVNPTKLLAIALSLAIILSSCNALPTQKTGKTLIGTAVAMTLQVNPLATRLFYTPPSNTLPTVTASPMPTLFPPNTPVWSAYTYTCELVTGGGNMTMNLGWIDRSTTEDGYRVYRDKVVIATLAPNSTFYVDVAFVATGKTLSYSIEAFNKSWKANGNTITYGCQ
ncbi:MAG: hypothetical protein HZB50_14400 [Chloroflexi bacterium]|nr:hypothetical protein [Chloroflexota bacterium]